MNAPPPATFLAAGALVLASCGTSASTMPSTSTNGGGWGESCAHSEHPVTRDGGCGWLAAPGRFAFCEDYPDGIQAQLTCYSAISGWQVNIPADDPPGKHPSARRIARDVKLPEGAMEMKAGETWYDSMPERTAEVVCQATKRFLRCDLREYRVWFKPDGSFAIDHGEINPKTYDVRYKQIEGSHH